LSTRSIRIGGASGFWGDAGHATAQLLADEGLDYLVYDYLAEITMSIMARARLADADKGYAPDFVSDVIAKNADEIARRGVRVLSNAGGVNPQACAAALKGALEKAGVALKVAVVEGDEMLARIDDFAAEREMFSGAAMPARDRIVSANAYLGAFAVAEALAAGADIVITGRCADSALALAAAIHAFGWGRADHDLLACGSLAGHLIECGPQATGGNFTDWRLAGDLAAIGYPIAEVAADGTVAITKPAGTAGVVSPASVAEQMLYEIGNPRAYILPDVICDFSEVVLEQAGPDRVRLTGAKGRPPSGKYKVSLTYQDGYRVGHLFQVNGVDARAKADAFVRIGLARARAKLAQMNIPDFSEVSIECFGGRPGAGDYEEISVKVAARHDDARALGLLLKEEIGAALATPPGLHFFTGAGRPKPSPVVRLFSFLAPATDLPIAYRLDDGAPVAVAPPTGGADSLPLGETPPAPATDGALAACRLEDVACARSGDKGDAANIGVIARLPALLPWIWQAIDEACVRRVFADTLKGGVERFYLPGSHAMNILMTDVLGGGGIGSILNDPQGKSFAQRLLNVEIEAPADLIEQARKENNR
jgi:hypothetical protein